MNSASGAEPCYEDQETSGEQVVSETLEMHGQQCTCDDKGNAI